MEDCFFPVRPIRREAKKPGMKPGMNLQNRPAGLSFIYVYWRTFVLTSKPLRGRVSAPWRRSSPAMAGLFYGRPGCRPDFTFSIEIGR